MAAQSQTITGQISNLEDQIEQIFNTIGQANEGVISDAIGLASQVAKHWEEIGKVLLTVIATYGAYKGLFWPLQPLISSWLFGERFRLFFLLSPP